MPGEMSRFWCCLPARVAERTTTDRRQNVSASTSVVRSTIDAEPAIPRGGLRAPSGVGGAQNALVRFYRLAPAMKVATI